MVGISSTPVFEVLRHANAQHELDAFLRTAVYVLSVFLVVISFLRRALQRDLMKRSVKAVSPVVAKRRRRNQARKKLRKTADAEEARSITPIPVPVAAADDEQNGPPACAAVDEYADKAITTEEAVLAFPVVNTDSEMEDEAAIAAVRRAVARLAQCPVKSSTTDETELRAGCACGCGLGWGCASHQTYSLGLLLAHRSLRSGITARGAPGLVPIRESIQ